MPPLEAWQMVYVKGDFLSTTHGELSCVSCHGGNKVSQDKDAAHIGLTASPSEQSETYCKSCHENIVTNYPTSLHSNQNGYYHLFEKRAGFDLRTDHTAVEGFNNECASCHASCGQCHVSRPESVRGGFIDGHNFKETPNMGYNCTACHGSRVGAEYLGNNEGFKADVHWQPFAKRCEFCHSGEEMHGTGKILSTRYDEHNTYAPRCEDCHEDVKEANIYHTQHWANAENSPTISHLSCQVCHSQDYKGCNACHTGGDGITGSSYLTFKIGKNHLRSGKKPYDYVTVRHIPIAPNTFEDWGIPNLENFSDEPTWKYTTPHNIQRWTARTDTTGGVQYCWEKCHNNSNPALNTYLRENDLLDYEIEANQKVIVP